MKMIFKILLGVVLAALIISSAYYLIFYIKPNRDYSKNRSKLEVKPISECKEKTDAVHFLATGSSDAILLESDGHFALIDCAEDSDNPRGFEELELQGYEYEVLDYLEKNAADENGKIHLDFILGTHAHSDHLGGFDTVVSDGNVTVDRAYLKRYDESRIRSYEVENWDNREVYEQTVNALKEKSVPIIQDFDETEFKLGNMNIKLFNTEYDTVNTDLGENDNSLGVLLEVGGVKVFLAGDINNITGDEDRLAPEIGKVNILKVGHHSYSKSTSAKWLKTLNPDVCAVTNDYEKTDKNTLRRITRISRCPILVTGSEHGFVAVIRADGSVEYYNETM